MPETKQRRRGSSPDARRTGTAKQRRLSRGWTFRSKPEPTGIKRVLGALTGAKVRTKKGGAAAAGGLVVLAGGLAALRRRRGEPEASGPGPVTSTTHTRTPANPVQPVAQDGP